MQSFFRFFIILFSFALFTGNILPVYASSDQLYVFYPTDIRPNSLQRKINDIYPTINTVAFGRVVDFYRQIEQLPPNAILSLKPVVSNKNNKQKTAFSKHIKGSLNGYYKEEYFLVSLEKPVDLTQLSQL